MVKMTSQWVKMKRERNMKKLERPPGLSCSPSPPGLHHCCSPQAAAPLELKMIGRAVSESEADEEDDEEKAKVVNSAQKDCFNDIQLM